MSMAPVAPDQVSVVVCTRNRPDLLERCLTWLARLDPRPREILVIDQSDTGESATVVERHLPAVDRLRRIATPTRGLSRARNIGIRAAKGEILAFTDDDCLVRPQWVGEVAGAFTRHPEAAAITGGSLPEPDPSADPRILVAATWHPEEPREFRGTIDPAVVGGGFNLSFRREWAERVGLFDPDLGPGARFRGADDTDFIHRLLRQGATIRYEPRVVVSHLPWRNGEIQAAVEYEYGHGIAVWALKEMSRGDLFPARVALRVLGQQGRRAIGGVVRGDRSARRTGWAYLSGLGRGTAAWLFSSPRGRAAAEPAAQGGSGD